MNKASISTTKGAKLRRDIKRHLGVYVLALFPFIYYVVFKYIPIFNAQIAFKDFMALDGVLGSKWVGLKNFKTFFHSFYFVFQSIF